MFQLLRKVRHVWLMRHDPVAYARLIGVQLGRNCRILGLTAGTSFGSEPYLVRLGDHVTVTTGVRFITHDGGVWVFREKDPDIDVIAPITVGNNVFIGIGAIIMPGVSIGDNCVIGAGAVVTNDIPSGYIAVGVPARCIKTIDEYWENIHNKAIYIRSKPVKEKERILRHMIDT